MTEKQYFPYSSYSFNVHGEIFDSLGNKLEYKDDGKKLLVDLNWIHGPKTYEVAVVLLICYQLVKLPIDLYDEVEPLFKDKDYKHLTRSNLTYRFKSGALESREHPGFYYIPFYSNYVINREGVVLSLLTGKEMSFHLTAPTLNRERMQGYMYTRLTFLDGTTKMLSKHRAIATTFHRYDETIGTKVVNHIDGNTTNNSVENLEIVTPKENNEHARRIGLISNKTIPFLVKNYKTGEMKRYLSQKDFIAEYPQYGTSFSSYRLRAKYTQMPADGLVFKYDDGSEWPIIDNSKEHELREQIGRGILARNVFTGDIVLFNGTLAGQELLGIKAATIFSHVENLKDYPINGYNFRYASSGVTWPTHSARHLAIYRDNPVYPTNGVIVKNVETGQEEFFTSKESAGLAHHVSAAAILDYIQNSKLVNGKYTFEVFKV
jgi:hypothetical protein